MDWLSFGKSRGYVAAFFSFFSGLLMRLWNLKEFERVAQRFDEHGRDLKKKNLEGVKKENTITCIKDLAVH